MVSQDKKKQEKYLFIDTNIYLGYFEMSSATESSLRELLRLLKKGNLKLILPQQVKDEYWRNKESIIAETRQKIESQIPGNPQLPPALKDLPEAKRVQKDYSQFQKSFQELLKEYEKSRKLEKLLDEIFSKAQHEEESKEIIQKAHHRYLKGNPPRKDKERNESYGDALIWETLLEKFSNKDLTIVTYDEDWYKDKERKSLKEFLVQEWNKTSKFRLACFATLAEFLNDFIGEKIIKEEVVKEEKSSKTTWATFVETSPFTTSTSSWTASTPFSTSTSMSYGTASAFTGSRQYYCPFCTKNITIELKNQFPNLGNGPFAYGVSGTEVHMFRISPKEMQCPYCKKYFNVDNL